MDTPPPPPYKSNSTVISLLSPDRNFNSHNSNDRVYEYVSQQQQAYNDNDDDSNATQIPDLTEYGPNCQSPLQNNNITPLKPSPPRSFERHYSEDENIPQTLDYVTLSPPIVKPPITVLLVLTPQPASLMETTAFEAFGACFCNDLSNPGQEWSCISLYAHFRSSMAHESGHLGGTICGNVEDVGIGDIHPYALREKLEQEKEVQWRLGVPVLHALVDKKVKKGSRAFVVCGLAVGDIEGVRAFSRTVSTRDSITSLWGEHALTLALSSDRRTSRHPRFLASKSSILRSRCAGRIQWQERTGKFMNVRKLTHSLSALTSHPFFISRSTVYLSRRHTTFY